MKKNIVKDKLIGDIVKKGNKKYIVGTDREGKLILLDKEKLGIYL